MKTLLLLVVIALLMFGFVLASPEGSVRAFQNYGDGRITIVHVSLCLPWYPCLPSDGTSGGPG